MKSIVIRSFALVAGLGAIAAGNAFGQQASPAPATGNSWAMPYQSGFWGNVGLSYGRSKLHADCPPGPECDLRDQAWRAYVGGKFNNIFGAEIGFLDLGKFGRGGGDTKSRGADLALIAGFPLGQHSSIFGKAGLTYRRPDGWARPVGWPPGRESGGGPGVGVGAQTEIPQNWAFRQDAARYRIALPGSTQNV